jgi:hypothetical protein
MILSNTYAGQVWHELIKTEQLTKTSTNLAQLVAVSEQLKQLDVDEVVYLTRDGKPVMCVSDILNKVNKRMVRYQSLYQLSGKA